MLQDDRYLTSSSCGMPDISIRGGMARLSLPGYAVCTHKLHVSVIEPANGSKPYHSVHSQYIYNTNITWVGQVAGLNFKVDIHAVVVSHADICNITKQSTQITMYC